VFISARAVAIGLGVGDQRAGVVELLAVLGQKFGSRDE
jgi:hypothetical protein